MAELLKSLYEHVEGRKETKSVTDFLSRFVQKDDEMENKFLEAVDDARFAGFREGMNAALQLFSEIHKEDRGQK